MENVWENGFRDNRFKRWFRDLINEVLEEFLDEFKTEITTEIKRCIKENEKPDFKKWIKSTEVKKMLNLSHGTLQMMRKTKTINFSRIGGTIYYNVDDIQRMLEERSNQ